ncbi:MAG: TadA family conjugal transfer-associated ATPase, partial [Mycobacteriaceae bacterium]
MGSVSALLERDELLDRVRRRLAEVPGGMSPAVVAAAIRAESGGVLGDTDLLGALRVLQTELSGA